METSNITDIKFVKSVEVVPGKNLTTDDFRQAAETLSDVSNVITAPENPMGLPGVDPIITTYLVARENGLIAMPHITPRDKNRLYIHSQVLTALKIGIRNFFVIGGDPINSKVNSKEVREIDVLETISAVRDTSAYLKGPLPGICIGSALNPYRANEPEILYRKMASGSSFFISQITYEPEHLTSEWVRNRNFKVSVGVMPITKKPQIEAVRKMGVKISEETAKKLDNSDDLASASSRMILDTYDAVKGYVDGIHIMPLGNNKLARQILESI